MLLTKAGNGIIVVLCSARPASWVKAVRPRIALLVTNAVYFHLAHAGSGVNTTRVRKICKSLVDMPHYIAIQKACHQAGSLNIAELTSYYFTP